MGQGGNRAHRDQTQALVLRSQKNTMNPTIVKITASRRAKEACGPAPKTMGIGPINTIKPALTLVSPCRTAAAIKKRTPTHIRKNPRTNSLKRTLDTQVSSGIG